MDLYRVVFRGKRVPGYSDEDIVHNLASLFRKPPEVTQKLLQQTEIVLRSGLNMEDASKYLELLAHAGLITHLEPDAEGVDPNAWPRVERRKSPRRTSRDRREGRREFAVQPDRRQQRGRRKTDKEEE